MSEKIRVESDLALQVGIAALKKAGVPDAGARMQMDLLLEAELRGRASHGLLRLPRVIERIRNGIANPVTEGTSRWRGDALLQVDGQQGLGPVVAWAALEKISVRAKTAGLAAAAISNNNHLGMLALYAERVARDGQVLIALTTSEALVHPWGGRQAMIGTNPVAIGVPATPDPFVLDMATSLISMGQVHDYANRGQALQPGWALDAKGDPTIDAAAAKDGAIAPFGGAKGYALGLAFEILVGALTASALGRDVAGTLDSTKLCNKGDVFIVIEPESDAMTQSVTDYLNMLRTSVPAVAERPVVVPGDRALLQRDASLKNGVLIAPEVWQRIRDLADPAGNELGSSLLH
ncbi:Ldh family oxidoreductase [Herbaspirillum lusitanum]|uniref:Ldh family oxidoreductase n=1 Tax=Herbaspirillum lusitanum TaxID=213312 RepID=A0ABW9A8F2_9BURK